MKGIIRSVSVQLFKNYSFTFHYSVYIFFNTTFVLHCHYFPFVFTSLWLHHPKPELGFLLHSVDVCSTVLLLYFWKLHSKDTVSPFKDALLWRLGYSLNSSCKLLLIADKWTFTSWLIWFIRESWLNKICLIRKNKMWTQLYSLKSGLAQWLTKSLLY